LKSRPLSRIRVACLQYGAGNCWQQNLDNVLLLTARALKKSPHLVALPENFIWRGEASSIGRVSRESSAEVLAIFQKLAKRSGTAFLLGSMLEPSKNHRKHYNTSYLISPEGRVLAKYRKIHLFDIGMHAGLRVKESRHIAPGKKVVFGKLWGVKFGLTICYDLRFPEIYRRLAFSGCRVVFVPANFTRETGRAHWDLLLRARAIENQMFVVAPAQTGINPESKIPSFGNSRIIDSWGRILAKAGDGNNHILFAEMKLGEQTKLRSHFPVLQHRRLSV